MNDNRFKQVIILRFDLKMSCGKAAVQASHAAVSALEKARIEKPSWRRGWLDEGQRKITLKVFSKEEILKIEKKAKEHHLPTALISDMGLTELEPGTITSLAIGPGPSKILDKITGSLPLF